MAKRLNEHILQVENSHVRTSRATKDDLSVLKEACLSHVLTGGGAVPPTPWGGGGGTEKPSKLALITYFARLKPEALCIELQNNSCNTRVDTLVHLYSVLFVSVSLCLSYTQPKLQQWGFVLPSVTPVWVINCLFQMKCGYGVPSKSLRGYDRHPHSEQKS